MEGAVARPEAADVAPELAIADGALGFWKALGEVWGKTREQRCCVHKTANVLNKMPKSIQRKAKTALQNIWMADTQADAKAAFDHLGARLKPAHANDNEETYNKRIAAGGHGLSSVVFGVFNLESSCVEAPDCRPRHDEHYHEA
jgi:hypothetical protein